jgi:hypothetical protein
MAAENHRPALLALGNSVVLRELLPVVLLVGREDAQTLAQGADVVEGAQDGGADELRAVGHAPQQLRQVRLRLECDYLVFGLSASRRRIVLVLLCNIYYGATTRVKKSAYVVCHEAAMDVAESIDSGGVRERARES